MHSIRCGELILLIIIIIIIIQHLYSAIMSYADTEALEAHLFRLQLAKIVKIGTHLLNAKYTVSTFRRISS